MVWPFKKQREIIDLTYLAKRGLIKVPEQEEYKDLTASQVSTTSSSASSSESDSVSSLGFLGAMAESAEPSSVSKSSSKSVELSSNRVEDIEYKLETISKRVNAMLDRLDLVEKKLSRDLRQAGG